MAHIVINMSVIITTVIIAIILTISISPYDLILITAIVIKTSSPSHHHHHHHDRHLTYHPHEGRQSLSEEAAHEIVLVSPSSHPYTHKLASHHRRSYRQSTLVTTAGHPKLQKRSRSALHITHRDHHCEVKGHPAAAPPATTCPRPPPRPHTEPCTHTRGTASSARYVPSSRNRSSNMITVMNRIWI